MALSQYSQLSMLQTYLNQPNGAAAALAATRTFTVFAPVNTALQGVRIPSGVSAQDFIGGLLRDHIATPLTPAVNFGGVLMNLNNRQLQTSATGSGGVAGIYQVCLGTNCASVTAQDITVCNGVIHIIDAVLAQ